MNLDELRNTEKAAVTVTDVADLLGLDERTVRRGAELGDLPSIKVGRRILFPVSKLLSLLGADDESSNGDDTLFGDPVFNGGGTPADKIYNCLRRAGIHTISGLATRTADEILDIRGMGAGSLAFVEDRLDELGMTLCVPPGGDSVYVLEAREKVQRGGSPTPRRRLCRHSGPGRVQTDVTHLQSDHSDGPACAVYGSKTFESWESDEEPTCRRCLSIIKTGRAPGPGTALVR